MLIAQINYIYLFSRCLLKIYLPAEFIVSSNHTHMKQLIKLKIENCKQLSRVRANPLTKVDLIRAGLSKTLQLFQATGD